MILAAIRRMTLRLALVFAAALLATACELPERKQKTLKDTKAPAGFTFDTTRSTVLDFAAAPALLPADGPGELTLARPDGHVIYEGQLTAAGTHLELPLAASDEALLATFTGPQGATTVSLALGNGPVRHLFR